MQSVLSNLLTRIGGLIILSSFLLFSRELRPNSKIQGRLNIINGASAECVMNQFYTNTGWIQIEGEIGRNGIDGLYYKKKHGIIKEVLVAESKWNTSRLGLSGKGKTIRQMSKRWILKTMDKLVKKLNSDTYKRIRELIINNQYRARLFRLKPLKFNAIQISIYKIKNKNKDIFNESLESRLKPMILSKPKNSFEKMMLNSYNKCRSHYLNKYLGKVLTDTEIVILLKDNYIQKRDVLRVVREH